MTKAPGSYVHGGVVIIPLRIWSIMASRSAIAQWRLDARTMGDNELYTVLNDLWTAHQEYQTRTQAPLPRRTTTPLREFVTVQQAATITGLQERSIRDACERGRLPASKVAGRWQIDRQAAHTYKAA